MVSVVIPTLNEEALLADTLASVAGQPGLAEIIVADGGSTDRTQEIAAKGGAVVISAPRGRARQMNAGAVHATGEALLFLHADTRLQPDALRAVQLTIRDTSAAGGCFRLAFDRRGLLFALSTLPIWVRWRSLAFGDRALFARRTAFDAVGGFPDQPIFEDVDFVRRLAPCGDFVFLEETVITSGRRFSEHGPIRQQLRNVLLWVGWRLGVRPEMMARFYGYREASGGRQA